jgi:hypothetical protein
MIALLQSNTGAPIFVLPLNDAGAGAVNTAPLVSMGSGTAAFTRATVAWTKLSTGLWAQVNSGVARSCYLGANTAVGAYGGYFADGAGTQLVTPTASIRDMTDASWVKTTMTVTKVATGIDGAANSASRLAATGATATVLQTLVAAASSRTYSAWVRRVSGTGTVKLVQGATKTSDLAASINSSTYTRCELNASVLNSAFGVELGTSGDVVEVDFNQFEAGAVATSPMASAGAARNADVLTYTSTGNILTTAGTAYGEYYSPSVLAVDRDVIGAQGGAELIYSSGTVATDARTYDGTTVVSVVSGSSWNTGVVKLASSWGGTTLAVAGGGVSASGTFTTPFAIGTNIGIGCGGAGIRQAKGTVQNVRIYSRAMPIQAMTA